MVTNADQIRRCGILDEVAAERRRQEKLKNEGVFPWSCADTPLKMGNLAPCHANAAKLAVLAEEFGECAQLVTEALISADRRNVEELREELIQVAAVCVAWVEGLDKEGTR